MLLLLAHAAATWFLTGLIWLVQLVHYPLMDHVARERAAAFAEAHQRRIAVVVIPPMVGEALTGALLLALPPAGLPRWLPGIGLAMLVLIWVSTALLQMPAHQQLLAGFDPAVHRRLVRTNWIRTILWTLRAILVAVMVGVGGG